MKKKTSLTQNRMSEILKLVQEEKEVVTNSDEETAYAIRLYLQIRNYPYEDASLMICPRC